MQKLITSNQALRVFSIVLLVLVITALFGEILPEARAKMVVVPTLIIMLIFIISYIFGSKTQHI